MVTFPNLRHLINIIKLPDSNKSVSDTLGMVNVQFNFE